MIVVDGPCPEKTIVSGGSVVILARGDIAVPGAVTYSCTKAALDHLALNLQASLKEEVSIGVLHPGEVDTDMQADLRTTIETQLAISRQFRDAKENQYLISPMVSARFIVHLLFDTSFKEFSEKNGIFTLSDRQISQMTSLKRLDIPPGYLKPLPQAM